MAAEPVYGELEIGLHRLPGGAYEVELRLSDPRNQAAVAPVRGPAAINAEALLALQAMPEEYGAILGEQLFADVSVRNLYGRARALLEGGGLLLRLRLIVGPSAPELHDLRWELLRDPDTRQSLSTSERNLLSRFIPSQDFRAVKLRPRGQLRALIAVSAPSDLSVFRLAQIDLRGEVARAREALAGVEVTVVGDKQPLTLERLVDALRPGIDILYLVCHGVLNQQLQSAVFLQTEVGTTVPVRGSELALRLGELPQPPRLAVLASCESGGLAEASAKSGVRATAEAALAPLLANAGVAAVLAMHGKISMETVRLLMPRFFRELLLDGQIDRALAVARGAVRTRPDSWMPALYLRLKSGRIWYEPRFTGGGSQLSHWKAVCQCVLKGQFIPILGPDLDENLFGGISELARRLAAHCAFPSADHERSDLAKVAQFLSIEKDRAFAHKAVQTQLVAQIVHRMDRGVRQDVSKTDGDAAGAPELPKLLDAVVEQRHNKPDDPYVALARLPASIYLTASQETVLFKTIKRVGKNPEALFCRWRPTRTNTPQEPRAKNSPTPETPIVYHVLGAFGVPESLVLTEDDFFDFLIATSTYKLMPALVRGSLTDSALLFLGFRLDDWTFRVLFRLIMSLEGSAGMRKYSHVGVQVSPEEHSLADVERARSYLERYFGSDRGAGLSEPRIDLYWGSPADFLKDLRQQIEQARAEETAPTEATGKDEWF